MPPPSIPTAELAGAIRHISGGVGRRAKAEKSEEAGLLKKEADFLRQQLSAIEKRLQGLEEKTKE